jgi:hypothetical protein
MFEKEIILEEQLGVRCLFQCSVAGKFPAKAGVGEVLTICGQTERAAHFLAICLPGVNIPMSPDVSELLKRPWLSRGKQVLIWLDRC